jgi:hypothetical protein
MRHNTRENKSVDDHGGILDPSRVPPTSSKIKGKILA